MALAKLLRVGELTSVWAPDETHEAIRDLVRARATAVETVRVHRQQVSGFMLKHGRIFPRKTTWGARHLRWLQEQSFDHPAHQIALQEMVEAVRTSKERVERLEAAIEEFLPTWSLGSALFPLSRKFLLDLGMTGCLDLLCLLESELQLIHRQAFGASAEAVTLELFDDLAQPIALGTLGQQHRL